MHDLTSDPNAWDAVAATYDRSARPRLTEFSKQALRLAALTGDDEVLDVACGPGTTTELAAAIARRVQSLDFSPKMIEQLRQNCADLSNVRACVGDGQELPFPDQSFTAAFSMFGLMFFPDPQAGLQELHRVLKPGGRALISSWVPMQDSPMMRPLGAALRRVLPDALKTAPRFAFQSAEELSRGLHAGGFSEVRVHPFSPSFPVPSAEHFWADTRETIFMTRMRATMGHEWAAFEAKILTELRIELKGVQSLQMPAFIGIGTKPAL